MNRKTEVLLLTNLGTGCTKDVINSRNFNSSNFTQFVCLVNNFVVKYKVRFDVNRHLVKNI